MCTTYERCQNSVVQCLLIIRIILHLGKSISWFIQCSATPSNTCIIFYDIFISLLNCGNFPVNSFKNERVEVNKRFNWFCEFFYFIWGRNDFRIFYCYLVYYHLTEIPGTSENMKIQDRLFL